MFMYKVNQKTTPNIFLSRFQKTVSFYPTRFSKLNLVQLIPDLKTSKYLISIRRSYIWNSFLIPEEKEITTMHKFKAITKPRMLNRE